MTTFDYFGHRTGLVLSTDNPDQQLPNPHYTDRRYQHAQTVYGREQEDLNYDNSERLWEWDYDKAERAREIANSSGANSNSARWYEAYLTAYFDKPAKLLHVMAGYNWATGYPYYVFGYRFNEQEVNDDNLHD